VSWELTPEQVAWLESMQVRIDPDMLADVAEELERNVPHPRVKGREVTIAWSRWPWKRWLATVDGVAVATGRALGARRALRAALRESERAIP